jgi:hypothetical protein
VGKSGHATDIAAGPAAQYCISDVGTETGGRSSPTVAQLVSAAETLDAAGGREVSAVVQGRDVAPEAAASYSCPPRPAALLTTACSWSL